MSENQSSGQHTEDFTWEGEQHLEEKQKPTLTECSSKDEIISVYEVFVKDDVSGQADQSNIKSEVSVISALPKGSLQGTQQLIQGDCALDLDAIDIISADGDVADDDRDEVTDNAVNEILEKESSELESQLSATNTLDENMMAHTNQTDRTNSNSSHLIDKDDPRSRLHYVKYLKREGKTLKIWECGICTKEFRHQYTLMRHLPTHTDERNFKCDACGKAFRQLSTLSQHKAIHSDARPYVCEFCKKTFNRVSTLISHRKTHSEHKPHKCHLCGKGFHQKGNLRNHVFTHTNERPYKCDICGKGFNQMSNLVCHKVKAHAHSEKMRYTCGICGKEFPRRSSLRAHEESKHGIKYRQPANSQSSSNEPKSSKSRNVRVVNIPEDEQNQNMFSDLRDKDLNMTEFMENIIINKIETKAMEAALLQDQTPFALFKPAKGIPVLVKVNIPESGTNHLLTPATAEDLKMSGTMNSPQGTKSVQIKVPVVATVTEKIDADGKISFVIEPPGPDQDQESLLTPVDSISECLPGDIDEYSESEQLSNHLHHQFPMQQLHNFAVIPPPIPAASHSTTDDELLELAALGGIQFVRATEDGRYEVMTNNEARDLMAQNSHDVKILGAEETEAINNVMNVHESYSGSPSSTKILPDDIKHQPVSPVIAMPSSDIIVLDPNNDQKTLTLGDIEILEDKELKQLLDGNVFEERFVGPDAAGVNYLSQEKIDKMLNEKSISDDPNVPVMMEDQESVLAKYVTPGTTQNDISNILSHRNDLTAIAASSLCNWNPHQQPIPYPHTILQEPMPYLKNLQNFNDEIYSAIFGDEMPSMSDHHPGIVDYNSHLKLTDFEDDTESMFMAQSACRSWDF